MYILYISLLVYTPPHLLPVKMYRPVNILQEKSIMQQALVNVCEWSERFDLSLSVERRAVLQFGY